MPPLERRPDYPGRLQKYPKIHVSTGEESSGSGTDSTQGLRIRHRWERNPERPPSNAHVDWPFRRPPERVPEIPVVCRKHLQQLEKIQEILHFRRHEAHFRSGVSKRISPNLWNFQRVLHTLAALKKFPATPSPLERKHEGRSHIQRSPVSASLLEMRDPFPA